MRFVRIPTGIAICAAIGWVAGHLGAQAHPATVEDFRVRQLVVVDAEGRERIVLKVRDDGSAVIEMRDPAGKSMMVQSVTAKPEATLVIANIVSKEAEIIIGHGKRKGTSGVSIHDSEGWPRLGLALEDERARFFVADRDGTTVFGEP